MVYLQSLNRDSSLGPEIKLKYAPIHSLALHAPVERLPVSLMIILESLLRREDGLQVQRKDVLNLAKWKTHGARHLEIPFHVARIVLQDYTGVPLLADLAAMRDFVQKMGGDPRMIEPRVPVSLVIDHSIQTHHTRHSQALYENMKIEFDQNQERYALMQWGESAFKKLEVIPPGVGIVHQVNLEYLAKGVMQENGICYPDTLVGTDSHTTMINGLGIVGFGVGGIEAEACMLGQPLGMVMPDVIGVHLIGACRPGVSATDVVLTLTHILRKHKTAGKIVEYFGEGAESLSVPDRATIANMAPDYGATMGYFPVDERTIDYYRQTGREESWLNLIRHYHQIQGLWGMPRLGEKDYTQTIEVRLDRIDPCIAGPKRPQDRILLSQVSQTWCEAFQIDPENHQSNTRKEKNQDETVLKNGDIVIAGITSCTNTSNPRLMIAAGLLAQKAAQRNLSVRSHIKTSLTPGSRVVHDYLSITGLLPYLEKLGFFIAGYGCTTCIGNVGPLDEEVERQIKENNLIVASVLSGNRNFEARIHPSVRANFLMSPPLVVAFAIAGTMQINLHTDPLGHDAQGNPVMLNDIWPCDEEIDALLNHAHTADLYRSNYERLSKHNPFWTSSRASSGTLDSVCYPWNPDSTYIAEPPFFQNVSMQPEDPSDILDAHMLLVLGDSITTDHISPAGSIDSESSAGLYLKKRGVKPIDFNSFGARRGHHEVMIRGTFSNQRLKNKLIQKEGGWAMDEEGHIRPIDEVCQRLKAKNRPALIWAGEEYGTGSSRDWAAKGTYLLGVKAVIAKSFERIHRSNLIGMGVLPCEYEGDFFVLQGDEHHDLCGLSQLQVGGSIQWIVKSSQGQVLHSNQLKVRLDTDIEMEYFRAGGILPYVVRQMLEQNHLNHES